jgi:hypothetical protein
MIVAITAVGTPFRMKRGLHSYEIRSKGKEHALDHMVRTYPKNLTRDFSGQMAISQMPGKTRKLIGMFVPDFYNTLGSGPNLQQPPILKLQAIPVEHGNCVWKIEKELLTLIRDQANATPVTRVKIKGDCTCRLLLRPIPSGIMY